MYIKVICLPLREETQLFDHFGVDSVTGNEAINIISFFSFDHMTKKNTVNCL